VFNRSAISLEEDDNINDGNMSRVFVWKKALYVSHSLCFDNYHDTILSLSSFSFVTKRLSHYKNF